MPEALGESETSPGPRRAARTAGWLAAVALAVPVAGWLAQPLLGRFGRSIAPHLVHLVVGLGAGLVFVISVLVQVRRHGSA